MGYHRYQSNVETQWWDWKQPPNAYVCPLSLCLSLPTTSPHFFLSHTYTLPHSSKLVLCITHLQKKRNSVLSWSKLKMQADSRQMHLTVKSSKSSLTHKWAQKKQCHYFTRYEEQRALRQIFILMKQPGLHEVRRWQYITVPSDKQRNAMGFSP